MYKMKVLATAAAIGSVLGLSLAFAGGDKTVRSAIDRVGQVSGVQEAVQNAGNLPAIPTIVAPENSAPSPSPVRTFFPINVKETDENQLWPMDDSVNQQVMKKLFARFQKQFPDVDFIATWDNDEINAQAWVDDNGKRHVEIFGGLMRHKSLRQEAVSLVTAHEVGHHYGGKPTYPEGLSCEGQADYWGAKDGMRKVYAAPSEYKSQMTGAIKQIKGLFSARQELTAMNRTRPGADNCGHPPGPCRIQTYEAGMNKKPKPACAGFDVGSFAASAR